MYMFLYLFALCSLASIIAVCVGLSDRHEKSPQSSASTNSWKKPSDLLHGSASGSTSGGTRRRATLIFIGCFFLPFGLCAQQVVHALSGTVESVNPTGKTITLKLDGGAERVFKQAPQANQSISFDKTLQAESTAATELHQVGQHIIMFYYGYDDLTTAVAFMDIGQVTSKPFKGSITQYDRHQHVLTVKGPAQSQKMTVNQKTVVDTADGAVDGLSYRPSKGRRILVVSSSEGPEQTALFVSPFE